MKKQIEQELNREPCSYHGDILAFIQNINVGEQTTGGFDIKDGIATIKVRGLLLPQTDRDYTEFGVTGYNILGDYLKQANDSPSVRQIVLDIDSNGGFVKGLSDVIDAIQRLDKPITSHATGAMNSAAYWLGVSTKAIHADKSAKIGSIGAYITHLDFSESYAKEGIGVHVFRSGKWKGAFDSRLPLQEHEKERLQAQADTVADEFMSHVAKMRGLSVDDIKSWEGDSFNATVALDKRLIDSVGDTMNLAEALAELDKVKAESKAKDDLIAKAQQTAKDKDDELKAYQAKVRDEQIQALGKSFDDNELTAIKAMSDEAFALFAKHSKTTLPKALTDEQFTAGVASCGDELDQAINNLK
ncbi:S49 family peptidase [Moraxella bovis]|uniref:S49 family peptidase n=1 Tax=Moraxella bovis TaxID=476 RepID=UPI002227A7F5|nr:S49 family peptidase [Moraxella bovis]UYZ69972.1 S49 family peptidase [Moraxella bovis]UZA28399.1 S49 family peptidase [Moraxella bovis]